MNVYPGPHRTSLSTDLLLQQARGLLANGLTERLAQHLVALGDGGARRACEKINRGFGAGFGPLFFLPWLTGRSYKCA